MKAPDNKQPMTENSGIHKPDNPLLDGVRVLDLTRLLAGAARDPATGPARRRGDQDRGSRRRRLCAIAVEPLAGSDACTTPVLTLDEALAHPQIVALGADNARLLGR